MTADRRKETPAPPGRRPYIWLILAGILEQQTGPVDRHFARVPRALKDQRARHDGDWDELRPNLSFADDQTGGAGEATLDVGYPYVPRSVDEMQVRRLLLRKRTIEPLLDEGIHAPETSDDIQLDSWKEQPPAAIVSPEHVDPTDSDQPFPADHPATEGQHACRLADDGPGPRAAERFEVFLSTWIDRLRSDSRFNVICAGSSNNHRTPLGIVNTYIRRDDGALTLSEQQTDTDPEARHQPTLLWLRFVPQAGLHMLEFTTPLAKSTDRADELRRALLTNPGFHESGCTVVTHSARGGLDSWSTHLASGLALPLTRNTRNTLQNLHNRLLERLDRFVRTADRLEHDIFDGRDVTGDQVTDALNPQEAP